MVFALRNPFLFTIILQLEHSWRYNPMHDRRLDLIRVAYLALDLDVD